MGLFDDLGGERASLRVLKGLREGLREGELRDPAGSLLSLSGPSYQTCDRTRGMVRRYSYNRSLNTERNSRNATITRKSEREIRERVQVKRIPSMSANALAALAIELGADAFLHGYIGSWGDTLDDDEFLSAFGTGITIIAVGYAFRISTSARAPSEVTRSQSLRVPGQDINALDDRRKMSRMTKKTGMDTSTLWAVFLILLGIVVYTYFRS
jgi:hypothetical protein